MHILVFLYGTYMKTGKQMYLTTFRFWRKIFGVGYAIGLFSGVVLTFELGLNWATYANAVGPIVSVFLCMELLCAFFLIWMFTSRRDRLNNLDEEEKQS